MFFILLLHFYPAMAIVIKCLYPSVQETDTAGKQCSIIMLLFRLEIASHCGIPNGVRLNQQ